MNLKVFSLILAVVLAFTAFSSFGVFATELEVEEEPTVEELAYTARMAMHFSWYIYDGIYTQWRMYYEFGSTLDEFDQWLISKGMFVEPLESKVAAELLPLTDFHTGQIIVPPSYLDKQPYYAFPSSITMKEIKEAYFSLFYYDMCNIFECTVKHRYPGKWPCYSEFFREDSDGKVYMSYWETGMLPEDIDECTNKAAWDSMRITYKDSQKIIIESSPDVGAKITAEFRKNKDGWRVYDCNTLFTRCPPPETGDNTPVLLTVTAVSVLGLCALAVAVGRRKKERF